MPLEKSALGHLSSLAASAENSLGSIDCRKVRTCSITCRVTYNTSATSGIRINLYFSADGTHFDTIPYTYFDVDLTAGETIQETHVFDFPEHGYMEVRIKNNDDTYASTNIFIFDTVVKWSEV